MRTNARHLATLRESSAELGQLWEETFSGVGFFHRDANLEDEVLEKYQPGLIIQERAFVDCSYLHGGLVPDYLFR